MKSKPSISMGTVDRIIQAAADLFFSAGYTKVTMEEIAEQAGVTKKTIYNHFPGKGELLERVVTETVGGITDHLERIARGEQVDFMAKLNDILAFVLDELAGRKRKLLEEFTRYTGSMKSAFLDQLWRRISQIIRALVREGRLKGFVRSDVDIDTIPHLYLTLIEGIIALAPGGTLPMRPGPFLIESIRLTSEGILTTKGQGLISGKDCHSGSRSEEQDKGRERNG